MTESLLTILLLAVVSAAPALKLSAAVLVPTAMSWRQLWPCILVFAGAAAPAAAFGAFSDWQGGSIAWRTPIFWALGFWLPALAAAWYLKSMRAPDMARPQGFKRACELSVWAWSMAMTVGVAVTAAIMQTP